MAFEYEVMRPHLNIQAHVQVKTGNDRLETINYKDRLYSVILFQANDLYVGEIFLNVTCISRVDVERFIKNSGRWLPARYRHKMEMLRQKPPVSEELPLG